MKTKKEEFLQSLQEIGDDIQKKVKFLQEGNNNPFLDKRFRIAAWTKFKKKHSFNHQTMNALAKLGEEVIIGEWFLFLFFFKEEY